MAYEELTALKNVQAAAPIDLDADVAAALGTNSAGEPMGVFVSQKESEDYLQDGNVAPEQYDGTQTEVIDIGGPIRPQGVDIDFRIDKDEYPERDADWEYLTGGIPIRAEAATGRGTTYPAFWSSDYDNPVILSNRHVMVNWSLESWTPEVGDGIFHGRDRIAELVDWTEEVHPDDGVTPGDDAIAELTDDARDRWQGGLLGFTDLDDPTYEIGDSAGNRDTLYNSGYRTSTTSGLVLTTQADLRIDSARFDPEGDDEEPPKLRYETGIMTIGMTLGGDSGSPSGTANRVTGTFSPAALHFAGNGTVSFGLPLERVLEKYGFEGWYTGDTSDGDKSDRLRARLGRWWRNLLGGTGV